VGGYFYIQHNPHLAAAHLKALTSISSYLYVLDNDKLHGTDACARLKAACAVTPGCQNHPFNTHYAMSIYGPDNAEC